MQANAKYGTNHRAVIKVAETIQNVERAGHELWLLIILLMNVLGGLAALDPLFNPNSVQV